MFDTLNVCTVYQSMYTVVLVYNYLMDDFCVLSPLFCIMSFAIIVGKFDDYLGSLSLVTGGGDMLFIVGKQPWKIKTTKNEAFTSSIKQH